MGLFSYKCRRCGKSILSIYSINDINGWMMHAVAITRGGTMFKGVYDGYGRLDISEEALSMAPPIDLYQTVGDDVAYWHRACWELDGEPTEYPGASDNAEDQGHFFRDEEDGYNRPDPREEVSDGN